jgi:DNA methylase
MPYLVYPMTSTPYTDFLASKRRDWQGDPLPLGTLPPTLFPWQAEIVRWACAKGRAAIWADTGLGKTAMQLAWADQIRQQGGGALILAPLAVTEQTAREAVKFGVPAHVCRSQADVRADAVTIANYEMLHAFDAATFDGVVLDESSILKAYSGSTKRQLVEAFASTRYRLCCTATPAPNDYLELGNHCEFLGVMRSGEMIMRFFVNDPMEAGNYRLKAHGQRAFWEWVATWALSLRTPADIGYDASGYVLPPLQVHQRSVGYVDVPPSDGRLFAPSDVSATEMHVTLRASSEARAAEAARLIAAEPDEAWLVWVNTDYDAEAMLRAIPDLTDVRGSDSVARKAECLLGFADGRIPRLMTKPSIAGFGLNWQHCARVIYGGLSFSYEQFYQALRRTWRFGQLRAVDVYVLSADNEWAIWRSLETKAAQHATLKEEMVQASREALASIHAEHRALVAHAGIQQRETGAAWEMWHGDSAQAIHEVADNSIGLSVFSPPFSNLYTYSDGLEDMGNSADDAEFFEHFRYLVRDLLRATIPGRVCAVHCKDLPRYKGTHGAAGLYDFPGACIRLFEEEGWQYHSRVTIWKDPVIEMQRTKNHGLLYKQLRKDSSASRQGMADYVITFRKWAGAEKAFPDPVTHTRDEFPLDQWQQWASPVWDDIQQTRVLSYQQARDDEDERHICPLQLDVIERCVRLWSNPGDLVFSPFAGIGSEGYEAVRLGRRFLGVELKPSYFRVACRHLKMAATVQGQGTLFAETAAEDVLV